MFARKIQQYLYRFGDIPYITVSQKAHPIMMHTTSFTEGEANRAAIQLNNVAILLLQNEGDELALIAKYIFGACLDLLGSQFRQTTVVEEEQIDNVRALIAQDVSFVAFENEHRSFRVEQLNLGSVALPVVLLNPEGQRTKSLDTAAVLHNFSIACFLHPQQHRSEVNPALSYAHLSGDLLIECIERASGQGQVDEAFELTQIVLQCQEFLFLGLGLAGEARDCRTKLQDLTWIRFLQNHFRINAAPAA